jgi:hypothetical protein
LQASDLFVFNPSLDELVSTAKRALRERNESSAPKDNSSESVDESDGMHLHYPDCAGRTPFVFTDPGGNYETYRDELGRNWALVLRQHRNVSDGSDLWIGVGSGECSNECKTGVLS